MDNELKPSVKKSPSLLLIVGILISAIVIVGAILFIAKVGPKSSTKNPNAPSSMPTQGTQPTPIKDSAVQNKDQQVKIIEIDGSNFKFTPNAILVNEGDLVKITFKNLQGFHDFVIDEFNVKTKTITANQTDEVQFTASKKGKFEFYCSVGHHRAMGMTGTLTVQ